MRSKLLFAGLIGLAFFFILTGCGGIGSNGSSYSSSFNSSLYFLLFDSDWQKNY